MSYYTPAPRASRRQYFFMGLAIGVTVMAAVLLLLALSQPRQPLPRFYELALVCQPAVPPYPSHNGSIPARLDPPARNSFTCVGATRP